MTTSHLGTRPSRTTQVAGPAALAIGGIIYFIVVVLALPLLRPDYSPIRRTVSEYAVGPYGFLMTSAFFALAVAVAGLAVGLWYGVSQRNRSRVGLVLLAVFSVCTLTAGLFPIDPEGAPETMSGIIHNLASLIAFICVIAAMILWSVRFRQDEQWRPFSRSALVVALLALTMFFGFFAAISMSVAWVGLMQRVFLATVFLWLLLTAIRLRTSDRELALVQ